MADNNEATALFGNMAGFCGCRGFSCLPMYFSGLSLASGFGVFETYYFALVRRPGGFIRKHPCGFRRPPQSRAAPGLPPSISRGNPLRGGGTGFQRL